MNPVASNTMMGIAGLEPSVIVSKVLYYLIAAVLLFSGVTKIIDPAPFVETLKAAFKFSDDLNILFATLLPIVEIGLGQMMLFRIKQKETLVIVSILFFCFFVFSIYGTVIGLNKDCGCFGTVVKSEFGLIMIIRNLVLLTVIIWLTNANKILPRPGKNK